MKTSFLLVDALNAKKIIQKWLSYFFIYFLKKQLRIIFYGYNMENLGDKNQPKNQPKFYCKNCDYGTSKKTNYNTHIISIKHKRVTDNYIKGQKSAEIQPTISKHLSEPDNFICYCGKEYKHRQGLWRHRKTCTIEHEVPSDATSLLPFAKGNGSSSDIPIELIPGNLRFPGIRYNNGNKNIRIVLRTIHLTMKNLPN